MKKKHVFVFTFFFRTNLEAENNKMIVSENEFQTKLRNHTNTIFMHTFAYVC